MQLEICLKHLHLPMRGNGNMNIKNLHAEDVYERYLYVLESIVGSDVKPRKGIFDVVKDALDGKTIILSAPPGYGKTAISYTLGYLTAKSLGPFTPRVIHILPLRSIVDDCYLRLFDDGKEPKIPELSHANVARQMLSAHESPWLQKTLIFTTIDTFTYCSLRLPPAESRKIAKGRTLGHGLYTKSAIVSSSVVFDEVQLFLEENLRLASVFASLLEWLTLMHSPLLVMSATLPKCIELFIRKQCQVPPITLRYGKDFRDQNFDEENLSKNLKTSIISGNLNKIVESGESLADSYNKVLIVVNTVKRCRGVAHALKKRGYEPLVLHGKIVRKDRDERLKKLVGNAWIAVTTQVIEAGVDISADILLSDAAPPCSLIQRGGRVLRHPRKSQQEGEIIVIKDKRAINGDKAYGIYDKELVKASLKFLEKYGNVLTWHLPYVDNTKLIGYEDFIEKVYEMSGFSASFNENFKDTMLIGNTVLKFLLSLSPNPNEIQEFIENVGGTITRDSPLILGLINKEDLTPSQTMDFADLQELFEKWTITLTLLDVKKLLKQNIQVLVPLNESEDLFKVKNYIEIARKGKIIDQILRGNISAIIIPENLYHDEYGLML